MMFLPYKMNTGAMFDKNMAPDFYCVVDYIPIMIRCLFFLSKNLLGDFCKHTIPINLTFRRLSYVPRLSNRRKQSKKGGGTSI